MYSTCANNRRLMSFNDVVLNKCCLMAFAAFLLFSFTAAQQKPVGSTRKVYEVALDNPRFVAFDRDLSEANEYNKLTFPEKLTSAFELNTSKKLKMKFNLKNKADGTPVTVHQAFVVFIHQPSEREIIYIAEPDSTTSRTYTFELDMKTAAKEFGGISGPYTISLIVGDALISNPLFWTFADIQFVAPPQMVPPSRHLPKSRQINWAPLPEIQHQFRVDEPRPPAIVSDTFAVLCAAPLLLLFVLWAKIGVNFGRFPISLWAVGFHVGLIGVFGLYTCYWLKLNMFQTLKWLSIVGLFTFVCGNRLLRSIATNSQKKQKPE